MADNTSIEEKLLRKLVPNDLSQEAKDRLECTVDDLVGASFESARGDATAGSKSSNSLRWAWKVAAAITLLAALAVTRQAILSDSAQLPQLAVSEVTPQTGPDFVVLKSTHQIDAKENDGLIIPNDGGTPHYRFRYRVTDEEQVRDPKTGTIITLRQPRQEVHTIPVTQF
ncbi:MAG: hypothetical protein KJO79_08980 [Verrucomicrobiae bacterium]|nr:hypothetical protein [Verrucomicrobiae bacterium]NNJ87302.1 hypothetical protein [Akkermansiaceae bacterium]